MTYRMPPERLREYSAWGGLDAQAEAALLAVASQIATNAEWREKFDRDSHLLYDWTEYADSWDWPAPEDIPEAIKGAYYLLLALEALPRLQQKHQARGIPATITQDTAQDLAIAAHRYHALTDQPGMERWIMPWFRLIASGELYRLGRLQFTLQPFRPWAVVYQNQQTGAVQALAPEGATYSADGYLYTEDVERDPSQDWTAHLRVEDSRIVGSPLSPFGMALQPERELPLPAWKRILEAGDTVLEIHIPEGESLPLEECRASLQWAREFFPTFYPNRPFVAFACYSWLFNNQLEDMLPADSNIIRFLREPYLFPYPSDGAEGLYFLFYRWKVDPAQAPRDTRLRRACLDYVAAGIPLRCGGMFLLPEHLPFYGKQFYRQNP